MKSENGSRRRQRDIKMAEREGFEPSVPLLAVHAISSRAPSASSDISPRFAKRDQCVMAPAWSLPDPYHHRKIGIILAQGVPGFQSYLMAERVGFEPTCPGFSGTSRFRVDPVTTTSVPLRALSSFSEEILHEFPAFLFHDAGDHL